MPSAAWTGQLCVWHSPAGGCDPKRRQGVDGTL